MQPIELFGPYTHRAIRASRSIEQRLVGPALLAVVIVLAIGMITGWIPL